MKLSNKKRLLFKILEIANQAAEKIMEIYAAPVKVTYKEDLSPVTLADKASHDFISSELEALTPNIPIISEEGEIKNHKDAGEFWLVDPLDGTKEFIQKNDEFTVNIALISNHIPVLGIVCAPALKVSYAGLVGDGAFKMIFGHETLQIHCSTPIKEKGVVVCSRNHEDVTHIERVFPGYQFLPMGSSLKFCKLAEGFAHIYPRFGRTMEWDTAAGQAVLMAAGGFVFLVDNKDTLRYGKKGFENPHFIATSSMSFVDRVLMHEL